MALKPSSNFSPSPNRLPMARSNPPSTMQIIRIQTMTSLMLIRVPLRLLVAPDDGAGVDLASLFLTVRNVATFLKPEVSAT